VEQPSRIIETNQTGPHDRLEASVRKHLAHAFKRPVADHTRAAFAVVEAQLQTNTRPLIFDSCCGVGDSSRLLAAKFPDHWVVGVDKSAHRLAKERGGEVAENLILVRADLNDFYRLAATASWHVVRHYILYPNPWPKAAHLGRRWHGSPVFPDILRLGGRLELRSNWKLYLEEFQIALGVAGHRGTLAAFEPKAYLTPFERKYAESGQPLYQLIADL
jgi:tRNA (guanine-N7-)-methyltransferase